jgi:hypothetical protein
VIVVMMVVVLEMVMEVMMAVVFRYCVGGDASASQVGVAGNLLVAVVICSRAHMQTTTNMYILNMAAADMLMCLGETINKQQTCFLRLPL